MTKYNSIYLKNILKSSTVIRSNLLKRIAILIIKLPFRVQRNEMRENFEKCRLHFHIFWESISPKKNDHKLIISEKSLPKLLSNLKCNLIHRRKFILIKRGVALAKNSHSKVGVISTFDGIRNYEWRLSGKFISVFFRKWC